MLMIIIINQLVSARIAKPLQRLNESVKEWEAGNLNPTIYVGGSLEVEHLGKTLRSTVEQINQLMHDILYEQEEKRKSELDALHHRSIHTFCIIHWILCMDDRGRTLRGCGLYDHAACESVPYQSKPRKNDHQR